MTEIVKQKTKALVMSKASNYILISLIFAAALSYIYFANIAVRSLTTLEKTKGQMQTLSTRVSEMESERLSLENSIDAKRATELGFVEVNNPLFVMRNSGRTSLSLKTD